MEMGIIVQLGGIAARIKAPFADVGRGAFMRFFQIALVLYLAGCDGGGRTVGGVKPQPTAMYSNHTVAETRNHITGACAALGMTVTQSAGQTVTCEYRAELGEALAMRLVSGRHSDWAKSHLRFTLVQRGVDVKIIGYRAIANQTAYGQVRSLDLDDGDGGSAQTQAIVELLAYGVPFCKAQSGREWQAACELVYPGWRDRAG
jgi:hypothetical protein